MAHNNIRFDLSPFLIHFFRKLDFEKADVTFTPESWGPGEIVEDASVTAFFLLRNAIRLQRLWATWSMRNDRRTVYGPHPAVCFTDMPVAAFVEAGEKRAAKGEAMSPIALVLPKADVHAAGALPAIYGLSTSAQLPSGIGGGPRIMPASVLPEAEQFRYVTLGTYGSVDWTHEREWRWPYRGKLPDFDDTPHADGSALPGLDLHFDGMGAIVKSESQAKKVLHDILVLHDQKAPGRYSFVLVGEEIPSLVDLRDPSEVQKALSSAAINLDPFTNMSTVRKKKLVEAFDAALASVDKTNLPSFGREEGGCWLWLTDAAHEMTRALVKDGRVHINNEARYLVDLPFDPDLALSQREELTRRLAVLLEKRHGLAATYHSVLGGFSPDGIPHYSDPPLENKLIFNYGSDE